MYARKNPVSFNSLTHYSAHSARFQRAGKEDIGDWETAEENYNAMQAFYKKFPKFLKNKFYLTSESYGGHCMFDSRFRVSFSPILKQSVYVPLVSLLEASTHTCAAIVRIRTLKHSHSSHVAPGSLS